MPTQTAAGSPARPAGREAPPVLIAAAVLIAVAIALRAWAIWGSWYYGDDIKFLSQAATEPLTLEYLFTRHQQQLMPGALLWTWTVGQGPAFGWWLAAVSILSAQVVASVSCLVFLHQLLGSTRRLLIPLAFYLFCPVTIGAYMWWAAAINQLPMQACFFLALAAIVRYDRRASPWLVAGGVVVVAISLLFYIKSLLIVGFLPLFAFVILCRGTRWDRVKDLVWRFRWWWIGLVTLALGYTAVYLNSGSSPVGQSANVPYGLTADVQVRRTFGPTILGGPWWWEDPGRPDQLANTPEWAVTASWVVIALIVAFTCLRYRSAWRAWLLVVVYLVPTVYLTASGRATEFGPDVGRYVRYLSDTAVVMTVAIAVVVADRTPNAMPSSLARWRRAVPALAVLFLLGSAWSTITYATAWHRTTALQTWVDNASGEVNNREVTTFIDLPVDASLVLDRNQPYDLPSRILAPLRADLRTITAGRDAKLFGLTGKLERAVVTPGLRTAPGATCAVGLNADESEQVRLDDLGGDSREWMVVSTISNTAATMTIDMGSDTVEVPVDSGLQTWVTRVDSATPSMTLTSTHDLCVDAIAIGAIGSLG